MRKLTVGFSSSTKNFAPFCKAIELYQHTNYSHVYFKFETTKNHVIMIYQASSTMLNYMSQGVFLIHNKVIQEFELEIEDAVYDKIMLNCMLSAGLGYSIKQVFGLLIANVLHLKTNPLSDPEKYVCSEWVAEQLEVAGYVFDKPIDLITPKDINLKLSK